MICPRGVEGLGSGCLVGLLVSQSQFFFYNQMAFGTSCGQMGVNRPFSPVLGDFRKLGWGFIYIMFI